MTILFLDFDGVLHPSEVYKYHGRGIVLEAGPEHQLFEHAELLATLLEPFPEVRIILSTSWCSTLGRFDEVKCHLPESLQQRVIGATWHSRKEQYRWHSLTRYQQIYEYIIRHQIGKWLAIDDDDDGWGEKYRGNLVHCDEWWGLGSAETQRELIEKLTKLRDAPEPEPEPVKITWALPGSSW